MKIAYITDIEEHKNDGKFYITDDNGNKHFRDIYGEAWITATENMGDEIHTVDCYSNLEEVDVFLLEWLSWSWILKLYFKGLLCKTVYFNAEPPTVIEENCLEGYQKLVKIFPYIFTSNSEWANNNSIFLKPLFYKFEDHRKNDIDFRGKKLVTGISANKQSNYKYELYSERERVYSYFERRCPQEFDFYGYGWDSKYHPSYKGTVSHKWEVFHQYKFAICFENTTHMKDYVTEKVYDCLCAGIVPIYKGATNIDMYVPKECYIDYDDFDKLDSLYEYIYKMSEDDYRKFLDAADRWLNDEPEKGHSDEDILIVIHKMFQINRRLDYSVSTVMHIAIKGIIEILGSCWIRIKKRL